MGVNHIEWNQGDRPPNVEDSPGNRFRQRLGGQVRPRTHSRYIHVKQELYDRGLWKKSCRCRKCGRTRSKNSHRIWVPTVPQPPYSPDLAPPHFFLFPKVKKALKRLYLDTTGNIKTTSPKLLRDIPFEDFQRTYNTWMFRWKKYIDEGGTYFENF